MAVTRAKTWISDESLTASDLNAEFDNLLDNAQSLSWPATTSKDFAAKELILDDDGDTSITADTDDQIDFKLLGKDQIVFLGTSGNEGNITMTDTDTGTAAGPILTMTRNNNASGDADVIGQILFKGDDSGNTGVKYAAIEATILDNSATTEDGGINSLAAKSLDVVAGQDND